MNKGVTAIGGRDAYNNSGYYSEVKIMKTTGDGIGAVSLGLTAAPYEKLPSALESRLDKFPECWFVGTPYEEDFADPTMAVYCNSKKNLRFINAQAKSKAQQVMTWRQGETLGLWVRKRDGKQKEWLMSVFVNHNRTFTCNCEIGADISKLRICVEAIGAVKSISLFSVKYFR